MATALSPKVAGDIKEGGGRHYRGKGLGELQAWKCVACGQTNAGKFAAGCTSCGAGTPGQQVRQPGEALVKSNPDGQLETSTGEGRRQPATERPTSRAAESASPVPRKSMAEQLRQRAPAVDYDEIERRVLHALDARLGGGYTDAERATIYMALECYTALWDDGTIEPLGGLNREQTRLFMAKIAPESGLEMNDDVTTAARETPDATDTQQTTPATRHSDNPDDVARAIAAGHSVTSSIGRDAAAPAAPVIASRRAAGVPSVPAPQFLDPDLGGDEGGEDDADRDGE